MSNSSTVLRLLELLKEKSIESTREMMETVKKYNALNKYSVSEHNSKNKEDEQTEHDHTHLLELTTTGNQQIEQENNKEYEEEEVQQPFLPSSGSAESLIELLQTTDEQNDGANYHTNNVAIIANRELTKSNREFDVNAVKNKQELMPGGSIALAQDKSSSSTTANGNTFASENNTLKEHSKLLDNVVARDYEKWSFANYTHLPRSKLSEASLLTEPNYVIAFTSDDANNKLSIICCGESLAHGALSSVYVGYLLIELYEQQQQQQEKLEQTSNSNVVMKSKPCTEKLSANVIIKIIRSEPTNTLYTKKFLEHCAFPLMKQPHDNIIEVYSVEIYIPSRESVELARYNTHISDKNTINDMEHAHAKMQNAEYGPWRFTVVEEKADGGSLQELIKRREVLSLEEIRWLAFELLQGLHHLHNTLQVVHNDVKPLNILLCKKRSEMQVSEENFTEQATPTTNAQVLSQKARTSEKEPIANSLLEWRCKLADFGLMTPISEVEEQMELVQETPQDVLKQSAKLEEIRGSTGFLSPEMCVGMTGNPVSDIWSLGITLFYVVTGFMPWSALEMQYPELIINSYRTYYADGKLFNTNKSHTMNSTEPTAHSTFRQESCRTKFNHDNNGDDDDDDDDDDEVAASIADNYTKIDKVCFGPVLSELNHAQYDPDLRSFVHLCLTENFLNRPDAATLLKHPFITQRTSRHEGSDNDNNV